MLGGGGGIRDPWGVSLGQKAPVRVTTGGGGRTPKMGWHGGCPLPLSASRPPRPLLSPKPGTRADSVRTSLPHVGRQ